MDGNKMEDKELEFQELKMKGIIFYEDMKKEYGKSLPFIETYFDISYQEFMAYSHYFLMFQPKDMARLALSEVGLTFQDVEEWDLQRFVSLIEQAKRLL